MSRHDIVSDQPPVPTRSVLGDVYHYLLRRPAFSTHVVIRDELTREHYGRRITSHLGISVRDYAVLNIHRIGIDAPVDVIFRSIPRDGSLNSCWPGHLARIVMPDGPGTDVCVNALGWRRLPLFKLTELGVRQTDVSSRHLLYLCHGGYPAGILGMFVRPSIPELNEERESQFFFVVSFNFYGHRHGWWARQLQRVWERIHNRATSHILDRFRRHCEHAARAAQQEVPA